MDQKCLVDLVLASFRADLDSHHTTLCGRAIPYHVSFWTSEVYIELTYATEGAIEPEPEEDIVCTVPEREKEREREAVYHGIS